jgi:hypothetical protein
MLRAGLIANREHGRHEMVTRDLANFATLAAAVDRPESAARLFGAARRHAETIGYEFGLPERASYERAAERARIQLGDDAYAAAFAAGRELPLPAALAEALITVDLAGIEAPPHATVPLRPSPSGWFDAESDRNVAPGH